MESRIKYSAEARDCPLFIDSALKHTGQSVDSPTRITGSTLEGVFCQRDTGTGLARIGMTMTGESDTLKIWNKACESAKVEDATPRDLRHKAIRVMKKAGFNDAFVGTVAGHSDPRTTKRFTHFSEEETRMPLQALCLKLQTG